MSPNPLSSTPFVVSRPVTQDDFFGRQQELDLLTNSASSGRHTVVVGKRRIGKTSLLLKLGHTLEGLSDPPRLIFCNLAGGLNYLLREIVGALAPRSIAPVGDHRFEVAFDLLREYASNKGAIVLLLDEVDGLLGREDARTAFALRALLESTPRITVIGAGYRLSEPIDSPSSPLYNIFHFLQLSGFSRVETREFFRTRFSRIDLVPTQEFIDEAFDLTSGYPYLLQALGMAIAEGAQRPADGHLTSLEISRNFGSLRESALFELGNLSLVEKLLLRELAEHDSALSLDELNGVLQETILASLPPEAASPIVSREGGLSALSSLLSRYLIVEERQRFRLPHRLLRDLVRMQFRLEELLPVEPPVIATAIRETRFPASRWVAARMTLRLESPSPVQVTEIVVEDSPGLDAELSLRLPIALSGEIETPFRIRADAVGSLEIHLRLSYSFLGRSYTVQARHTVEFYTEVSEFRRLSSPYVFGTPVVDADLFFGREGTIEHILELLRAPRGEKRDLALVGRRRIGKTSILLKLSHAARDRGFLPVEVDLETVQPKTLIALQTVILEAALHSLAREAVSLRSRMALLAARIGFSLRRLRFKAEFRGVSVEGTERAALPNFEVRLQSILRFGRRHLEGVSYLLILIDEATLLLAFREPHVLSYLRGIIQAGALKGINFVIAGTDLLYRLTSKEASPLYNLFLTVRIGALDKEAAERLVREPIRDVGVVFADEAVARILQITSCIPYWVQAVCHYLIDILNEDRRLDVQKRDVDRALSVLLHNQDLSLMEIWNDLSDGERLVLALLAEGESRLPTARIGRRVADLDSGISSTELSELVARLESLGVVSVMDGLIGFHDGILKAWISKNKRADELAAPLREARSQLAEARSTSGRR